ncbi:putative RNase H-like nuclease (RuvC/YqgF family) [Salirhabdus euzebyi]|uniref:Putative RNase H-like nuclease (RuvC/YqgF family) n=1 Tax=Salirhabdus euzebyi TaxID=394506 RepID=A0A841Q8S5_9BACI|nr:hypothetical protein [Salirhabdus euzebyi]MBB6454808.1 putative RNase H-like nuclease (RuvC/YqgF family) [Salirhabdus euzebyi]
MANEKALQQKIENLEHTIEKLENKMEEKTNHNDVRVILDESLKAKKIVTEDEVIILIDEKIEENYVTYGDMEKVTNQIHLNIIKWVVGTGLSVCALTVGLLRILL